MHYTTAEDVRRKLIGDGYDPNAITDPEWDGPVTLEGIQELRRATKLSQDRAESRLRDKITPSDQEPA